MKVKQACFSQLPLAVALTLAAMLALPAMAQDDSQDLQRLDFVSAGTISQPGGEARVKFSITGFASECHLKGPLEGASFGFLNGVSGSGEKEFTVTGPGASHLLEGTSGDLVYTVRCRKFKTRKKLKVHVPYRIPGVRLTVNPDSIPDPSARMKFTVNVVPEGSNTVRSCELALPEHHGSNPGNGWAVDTTVWKNAPVTSSARDTFRYKAALNEANVLSASSVTRMTEDLCIANLPFRARCNYNQAGVQPVTVDALVDLKPVASEIKLIPGKTMVNSHTESFSLTLRQKGDLKACRFEVNGSAVTDTASPLHKSRITLNQASQIFSMSPADLGMPAVSAQQGNATITVDVYCDTVTSVNDGADRKECDKTEIGAIS